MGTVSTGAEKLRFMIVVCACFGGEMPLPPSQPPPNPQPDIYLTTKLFIVDLGAPKGVLREGVPPRGTEGVDLGGLQGSEDHS